MSIELRVAGVTASSSTKDCTITRQSTITGGDLMVMVFDYDNAQEPITAPEGWVEIGTRRQHGASGIFKLSLWYKIAGGAEPNTYTFSQNADGIGCIVILIPYIGVDEVAPFESAIGSAAGDGTDCTVPEITTVSEHNLIFFVAASDGPATFLPPTGMVERVDGNGCEVADMIQNNAGPTGDFGATASLYYPWAAFLVAFREGSGGGSSSSLAFRIIPRREGSA